MRVSSVGGQLQLPLKIKSLLQLHGFLSRAMPQMCKIAADKGCRGREADQIKYSSLRDPAMFPVKHPKAKGVCGHCYDQNEKARAVKPDASAQAKNGDSGTASKMNASSHGKSSIAACTPSVPSSLP